MQPLSKANYLRGRQCPRRLWLRVHRPPEPAAESPEVWEEREAEGERVEALVATRLESPIEMAGGGDLGTALLAGRPLLQAPLRADGLLAIVDVLEPRDGGWYLWEVKASTHLAPIMDWDLAFQVAVARAAELTIVGAGVFYLDDSYVRSARGLDIDKLLVTEDRTADVIPLLPRVYAEIAAQQRVLEGEGVPAVRPSSHCKGNRDAKAGDRPSACGQLTAQGYCGSRLPEHWNGRLMRLSGAKRARIEAREEPSIETLDPEDAAWKWTPHQKRMIEAVLAGAPVVEGPALRAELEKLRYPLSFVDFEFDPGMAVPRFEGSSPYTRVPFQWSLHVQAAPGGPLEEREPFLHLGTDDPRRSFLESLLAALPAEGSVVVFFKSAEATVLKQVGAFLGGDLQRAAQALITRLYDCMVLLQAGYYHPDQQGSYSIKKVAPALLGRGYEDLEIQDGMAAVVAWHRALEPDVDPEERERRRQALLAYCGRDTVLMHEIVEKVRALAT